MRQAFIPRNNPTLNKRLARSMCAVSSERQLALSNKAADRYKHTKEYQAEIDSALRAVIAACDKPRVRREHIVRPERIGVGSYAGRK